MWLQTCFCWNVLETFFLTSNETLIDSTIVQVWLINRLISFSPVFQMGICTLLCQQPQDRLDQSAAPMDPKSCWRQKVNGYKVSGQSHYQYCTNGFENLLLDWANGKYWQTEEHYLFAFENWNSFVRFLALFLGDISEMQETAKGFNFFPLNLTNIIRDRGSLVTKSKTNVINDWHQMELEK